MVRFQTTKSYVINEKIDIIGTSPDDDLLPNVHQSTLQNVT